MQLKLYGLWPLLASCNLGALHAESFCEHVTSCANNVVTKLHMRLLPILVEEIVILRMYKGFMDWIRAKCGTELVCVLGQKADKPARSIVLSGCTVQFL